jgi:hypothetical protein
MWMSLELRHDQALLQPRPGGDEQAVHRRQPRVVAVLAAGSALDGGFLDADRSCDLPAVIGNCHDRRDAPIV